MKSSHKQPVLIKDQLQQFIQDVVMEVYPDCGLKVGDVHVDHPREERNGDYATTVALTLTKLVKDKPISIATKLKEAIDSHLHTSEASKPGHITKQHDQKNSEKELTPDNLQLTTASLGAAGSIEKVLVAPPGFLNLLLTHDFLVSQVSRVLSEEKTLGKGQRALKATGLPMDTQKVMVEYTDPNPFKEFHIGHLYSNIVGETLCRLFEACGAEVKRADYFGDVGMHVAKSLYGILHVKSSKLQVQSLKNKPVQDRVEFLGQAYAAGATAYEEDEKAQKEIKRINFLIYIAAQRRLEKEEGWKPQIDYSKLVDTVDKNELKAIQLLFETGRKWSLEYFEQQYRRLDTGYVSEKESGTNAFDYYYPESKVGEYGIKLVREGLEKGIFEESKGAIVFRGDKHGLHTRVFINSLGLPTYEAKELGLAPTKYKDFPYDRALIVTGNEIAEYFKVLIAAMKQVEPELGNKTKHLSHGMVRLPSGKMSSRTGKIITGKSLLDNAVRRAKELANVKGIDPDGRVKKGSGKILGSQSKRDEVSEYIGVGAVKYALLKNGIGADIAFSFDESLSFEGNSGPYLQYTYARAQSVLRKSQITIHNDQAKFKFQNSNFKLNAEELVILRTLYQFPEAIAEAASAYSPHVVCTYLYALAGAFNTFYNKHAILPKGKMEIPNPKHQIINKSEIQNSNDQNKTTRQLDNQTTNFRLDLTKSVAITLKNGLTILGIASPEEM